MKTLNYKEAAEFLHITPGTLRNWVCSGKITPLKKPGKKGRVLFCLEELKEWLAAQSCRDIKTEPFQLDHEKQLTFRIHLFNSTDDKGCSVLAKIGNFPPGENGHEEDLTPEEFRAIARAFLCAAEKR